MHAEGVLLIDKPAGPTSHDVIARLRRLSGIRRIGHAGTLDPLATGLLIVCTGRTTRLIEYLMDKPKRYQATVRLGRRTETFDAEGAVVEERAVTVTIDQIVSALQDFRGPIVQYAPAYSAVKRDGVALYKLARQGVEVERPRREVTIHELALRSWESPYLKLEVSCSSGTYIRSLADDLGQALRCGGYLSALRRTEVGSFPLAEAVDLEDLDGDNWQSYLLPPDTAVRHLSKVFFAPEDARRLFWGQRVPGAAAAIDGSPAAAYEEDGRFLGIVVAREKEWQPHKMFPSE